ncbi:flagellar basal-body rod protein FlgB [Rhodovulum bhavnagarense]|uniref:Flagellar basal-body rod protein FlgB n=1 Tax=Rhodovulum bhavnagarense TaxID=992286 RepID=A0A4R2RF16_9RHOB|nr:FlgB family protein [Rhodovulum bhavnagarense]TCP61194.1 flagellar basal-body rod protein FlgB [Rhodovulum bhavnagarense]
MPEILQMAQALARHASARQAIIARNVANADTPGYRARDVAAFSDSYRAVATLPLRITRQGHLGATRADTLPRIRPAMAPAAPNGNTVSLEEEMLRAAQTQRANTLALSVYRSALGILRTSLGRTR